MTDQDTGGASRFWTSDAPHVAAARTLVKAGRLSDAEADLRPRAAAGDRDAEEGLQVVDWVRRDYPHDAAAVLERVRTAIPDASAADVERWTASGELQHQSIDGRVRYFRPEPTNLLRFGDEAKRRRTPLPPDNGWKLVDHVARVVAAADKEGKPNVVPIRCRATYGISIPTTKAGEEPKSGPPVRPGMVVRAWLPFPQAYRQQGKVYLVSTTPPDGRVAPADVPHRSVYFEGRVADDGKPTTFAVTFEYETAAWCPALDDAKARPLSVAEQKELAPFLGERPPHVALTADVRAAVAEALAGKVTKPATSGELGGGGGGEVVGGESGRGSTTAQRALTSAAVAADSGPTDNPLAMARRIFRWACTHIDYRIEQEYGTIPSLPTQALALRRGDCGVYGMLFIALCRAAGIPARWQSGWQTRRDGVGMHDWAEFYVAPWGWLCADPSYGYQPSGDPRVRDFYFGHFDAYRLIVNADYGRPLWPAKRSVRSEPLDFQRGEVEVDGKNLYFDRWDYTMDLKWLDEGP
jgi:transglutaminase-like putative cysteine protease